MDYLSIREEALIEASRLQRQSWDEYMKKLEKPKQLAAGQRVVIEGREHVVQTARNWARLRGQDPERAVRVFRRHPHQTPLVWLVPLPADRSPVAWQGASYVYGGTIPSAGDPSVPPPVTLFVGDRVEVEGEAGLVYLSHDGPKLAVAG